MSIFRGKPSILCLVAVGPTLLLAACAHQSPATQAQGASVANVDLRVAEDMSVTPRTYKAVSSISVPKTHTIGNKYFPYEGIGWENELIGYRVYLDERAIADVFGKLVSQTSLTSIEFATRYHEMSSWGMDAMHVGPSMGIGGLGLYRGNALERFGKNGELSARVVATGARRAAFEVNHRDVPLSTGATGYVSTNYELKTGSPVTIVKVSSSLPENTLATGLVLAQGAELITPPAPVRGWSYIAHWGDFSQNKDQLGIALFYKTSDVELMPIQNETRPIRFRSNKPTYAFAAVWGKGPQSIDTKDEFTTFLARSLSEVAQQ